MKNLVIASKEHIDDIVRLRVEMQIEDWNTTLNKDFSCYAESFAKITREHIQEKLIILINFVSILKSSSYITPYQSN